MSKKIVKNQLPINTLKLRYNTNNQDFNNNSQEYVFDENSKTKIIKKLINDKTNTYSKKNLLSSETSKTYIDILNLYNIITFDDLFEQIKLLIKDNKNYYNINRLINCWIRHNFDDLKNKYNILVNIYIYILKYLNNNNQVEKKFIIDNIFENKLELKIKKWFETVNKKSFILDLFNYLLKKLQIKILLDNIL
jgi:hypothetical protein